MMVWKRVLQTLRGGTGTRLVLVSIYAVLTYRFYMSGQDRGIFIGHIADITFCIDACFFIMRYTFIN